MEEVKLTAYSKGSGCGCKIEPEKLHTILSKLGPQPIFQDLLVGNQTFDDASVLQLSDELALVSSLDFFTPLVNNPFDFGRIAAANAISDIYAMGAKPVIATAILGWPTDVLPLEMAAEVLKGAQEICNQANIAMAGGHSVNLSEPFFGLHVNGIVHPQKLVRNNTPQHNDLIVLTKPIGTGMLGAAHKRGLLSEEDLVELVLHSSTLNTLGYDLAQQNWVNAMTDVTGFGLIGHLNEMCGKSFSAELNLSKIPLLNGVERCMSEGIYPDNTYRNFNAYGAKVKGITGNEFLYLFDPQTNGGLLMSISPQKFEEMKSELEVQGVAANIFHTIGVFKDDSSNEIRLFS